jgi:hypothetical protein
MMFTFSWKSIGSGNVSTILVDLEDHRNSSCVPNRNEKIIIVTTSNTLCFDTVNLFFCHYKMHQYPTECHDSNAKNKGTCFFQHHMLRSAKMKFNVKENIESPFFIEMAISYFNALIRV